jgi:hypothetical protein
LKSPVLVIGFTRPEHLARVLDRVREAAPPRVYVAIDGPRSSAEAPAVLACQNVARGVDWAETELRFRASNLGCQDGVIDAVSWMLSRESEGVVVEDDSIPSHSFFPFCDELLERFRGDDRVLAVSGESRVPSQFLSGDCSYRFTYMGAAGAWATWSDRWRKFVSTRVDKNALRTFRGLKATRHHATLQQAHWAALSLANRTRVMDSWAYPFMLHGMTQQKLTATPNVNLVADHGMGVQASHMQSVDPLNQAAGDLTFPLQHPSLVAVDEVAERWSEANEVGFGAGKMLRNGSIFVKRLVQR